MVSCPKPWISIGTADRTSNLAGFIRPDSPRILTVVIITTSTWLRKRIQALNPLQASLLPPHDLTLGSCILAVHFMNWSAAGTRLPSLYHELNNDSPRGLEGVSSKCFPYASSTKAKTYVHTRGMEEYALTNSGKDTKTQLTNTEI